MPGMVRTSHLQRWERFDGRSSWAGGACTLRTSTCQNRSDSSESYGFSCFGTIFSSSSGRRTKTLPVRSRNRHVAGSSSVGSSSRTATPAASSNCFSACGGMQHLGKGMHGSFPRTYALGVRALRFLLVDLYVHMRGQVLAKPLGKLRQDAYGKK